MSEQVLHRPAEVAARLGVSTSTLRRWSQRFAEYLSPDAGEPAGSGDTDGAHRRYTDEDLATLLTIKGLLAEGFTYQQVERRLAALRRMDGKEEVTRSLVAAEGSLQSLSPAISILADTLHTVADGQQAILNAQQANRELMGVVVQDNFNIKEENTKLRDRMLELEREMAEMRRRDDAHHAKMEARMQAVESALDRIADQLTNLQRELPRRNRGLLGWLTGR
ncbi:MAG TPA: MerR family transcriptional regulator [Caldilineae bacterium]|nr:MerR family transcriptional regulator [Caldilineae bacterium]